MSTGTIDIAAIYAMWNRRAEKPAELGAQRLRSLDEIAGEVYPRWNAASGAKAAPEGDPRDVTVRALASGAF